MVTPDVKPDAVIYACLVHGGASRGRVKNLRLIDRTCGIAAPGPPTRSGGKR